MDILSYIDHDPLGEMASLLPDAVIAQGNELPLVKPGLAVVQLSTVERERLACELVRKRVPVAVLGARDIGCVEWLMANARRNRTSLFLLESWRFIPAVAAAKEICVSGCLGRLGECRISCPCRDELEMARMQDVAEWLGGKLVYEAEDGGVHLALDAQFGGIDTTFSLDGQSAEFTVTIAGRRHRRPIPRANPLISELAVLSLALKNRQNAKDIPLLMCKIIPNCQKK